MTDIAHVTDAVIHSLTQLGRQVGDGEAPGAQNTTPPYPYLVVDKVAGSTMSDAASRDTTVVGIWQVTAVSRYRWEAEHWAEKARGRLLDWGPVGYLNPLDGYTIRDAATQTVITRSLAADDGLLVRLRELESDGGHIREGAVSNHIQRFRLTIDPL